MLRSLKKLSGYGPDIFRLVLLGVSLFILIKFYPGHKTFHYNFEINKPWIYPDLYAPYDFVVSFPDEEVAERLDSIKRSVPEVLTKQSVDVEVIRQRIKNSVMKLYEGDSLLTEKLQIAGRITDTVYQRGFAHLNDSLIYGKYYLREGNQLRVLEKIPFNYASLKTYIDKSASRFFPEKRKEVQAVFFKYLKPDYVLDRHFSDKLLEERLKNFNPHKKFVYRGELLISKGQIVDQEAYEVLNALKQTYYVDTQLVKVKRFGFFLASLFLLLFLMFYLKEYEPKVFGNSSALTLIFSNIVLMVISFFLTVSYLSAYLYVVPIIVVPFILKNFFNWRIALASSIVVVLIASFGMPDPFAFILLQLSASWIAVISTEDLTRRSKMFLSAGKAVWVYIFMYIAYELTVKGTWDEIKAENLLLFVINGFLAVALIHELILIYEKIFGQVSDVSLLELLNTNNKLLKKLADKAPGTFHHSLQVANLAESVANELNANSLLVRVGALYHDLGKMKNPKYFTENQSGSFNPHDDLAPEESAKIIIKHVIDGIETARRNGLPEKVIDFIRTHHGTDIVQYFYDKAKQSDPGAKVEAFTYPGPNPFSKETAIVMMADSVEAASKSLNNPTKEELNELVDKVIDRKLYLGLFNNANITLKEINLAKKVLKNKLRSIYHPRVAYPGSEFEKNKEK